MYINNIQFIFWLWYIDAIHTFVHFTGKNVWLTSIVVQFPRRFFFFLPSSLSDTVKKCNCALLSLCRAGCNLTYRKRLHHHTTGMCLRFLSFIKKKKKKSTAARSVGGSDSSSIGVHVKEGTEGSKITRPRACSGPTILHAEHNTSKTSADAVQYKLPATEKWPRGLKPEISGNR